VKGLLNATTDGTLSGSSSTTNHRSVDCCFQVDHNLHGIAKPTSHGVPHCPADRDNLTGCSDRVRSCSRGAHEWWDRCRFNPLIVYNLANGVTAVSGIGWDRGTAYTYEDAGQQWLLPDKAISFTPETGSQGVSVPSQMVLVEVMDFDGISYGFFEVELSVEKVMQDCSVDKWASVAAFKGLPPTPPASTHSCEKRMHLRCHGLRGDKTRERTGAIHAAMCHVRVQSVK
jgi:hypothetical protein